MAKSQVVGIARQFTGASRREEHLNCPAVFAAEIIQISDVVIGLIAKPRHVVTHAQLARLLIALQRSGKIIQADQDHRHVMERDGDVFPIFMLAERLIRAFVARQSLFETILPVKNVSDVVLQARQPPAFSELCKDRARAFRCRECAVVFADENQRLDGVAQRARRFSL